MQIPTPNLVAGGTIGPCRCVKLSTAADKTGLQATGYADNSIGISQEGMRGAPGVAGSDTAVAFSAGDPLGFSGVGNMALAEIGGNVTAGDKLVSDANGRVITATAQTALQGMIGYSMATATYISTQIARIPVYVLPTQLYY